LPERLSFPICSSFRKTTISKLPLRALQRYDLPHLEPQTSRYVRMANATALRLTVPFLQGSYGIKENPMLDTQLPMLARSQP